MSKLSSLTPIAAVLAVSVAAAAHAGENPLALKPASGLQLAEAAKGMEGKCGASMGMADEKAAPPVEKTKAKPKGMEGKCGASMGMGGKSAPKAAADDKAADDKPADKPAQK